MTCLAVIALVKDLILAGAAITGSIVAVKGLSTWRRQFKGQTEYDLARRILVTLFRYRDAINGVRNPVIFAGEQPSPPEDEARTLSREEKDFYGLSKAYQARWDRVSGERIALYPDLLEAEAIWGNNLNDLFKPVVKLEHELLMSLRHFIDLSNPKVDERRKEAIRNIDKKRRDVLYDEDENDDFKKELIAAIRAIEDYLKPKLRHEQV